MTDFLKSSAFVTRNEATIDKTCTDTAVDQLESSGDRVSKMGYLLG